MSVAPFGVMDGFVRVCVWVFQDDVPGVDEAWEDAQTAEGDVDDAVGAADAAFYPYCKICQLFEDGEKKANDKLNGSLIRTADGWKQNGQKHQETVGATHFDWLCPQR